MTEKKLRPEQRKLWRRIYLTAYDGGANAKEAAYEADTAVQFWEERGAFEVESSAPPNSTTTTWDAFSITVGRMLREERTVEQIAEESRKRQALAPCVEPSRHTSRLHQYYCAWTTVTKWPITFRTSPDGAAILMGFNSARGTQGMYLVGFPALDIAKWVAYATVESWPVLSDLPPHVTAAPTIHSSD